MLPPPCSSATRRDVQPRSTPRRQYFSSKPAASLRRRRSSSTGTCSSRNLPVVSRKNCWSADGSSNIDRAYSNIDVAVKTSYGSRQRRRRGLGPRLGEEGGVRSPPGKDND